MPTGYKIKEIRLKKGLTQKQLGDLCGIADSNIRKYETGKQNPKIETLQKIAIALDVPLNCLLDISYSDDQSSRDIKVHFADNLSQLLNINHLSIDVLCKELNTNKETVYMWLNAKELPSISLLSKLSNKFSIPANALFKANIEKYPSLAKQKLNHYFDMLNDYGQEIVINQAENLSKMQDFCIDTDKKAKK